MSSLECLAYTEFFDQFQLRKSRPIEKAKSVSDVMMAYPKERKAMLARMSVNRKSKIVNKK